MTKAVPDILARIVDHKRHELAGATVSRDALERQAAGQVTGRRDFVASLRAHQPAIIAEIKKASPSKGILSHDFRPAEIAATYAAGGAAALSVLTDVEFFKGSLDYLQAARQAVTIPVLRKDFTIDEYHVVEAAAHGADAILLIASILDERQMRRFRELAAEYQMAALVEVHDADELKPALASGAVIIGVNNRNLRNFEVSLDTSLQLAALIPPSVLKVSESGIETRDQILCLQQAGYSAFLIGEHLMKSGNAQRALEVLTA